jgi:hypothetical protein
VNSQERYTEPETSVMRHLTDALIVLLLCTALVCTAWADAEGVIFTTRTAWASPVLISSPLASKDFGFQSVILRNTSTKIIEVLDLRAVLSIAESVEEEVDGGRIHVSLEPGQSKRIDVYLGPIRALQQKAHSLRLDAALTVLSVSSADFSDGTRWTASEASSHIDFPGEDARKK